MARVHHGIGDIVGEIWYLKARLDRSCRPNNATTMGIGKPVLMFLSAIAVDVSWHPLEIIMMNFIDFIRDMGSLLVVNTATQEKKIARLEGQLQDARDLLARAEEAQRLMAAQADNARAILDGSAGDDCRAQVACEDKDGNRWSVSIQNHATQIVHAVDNEKRLTGNVNVFRSIAA